MGDMDATEALISIIFSPEIYSRIRDKVSVKKTVYEDVAQRLEEMGFVLPWERTLAGEKVSQKYRNLVKKFKEFTDKSSKTGSAPPSKIPKYYDLLHPHLSKRHDIIPRKILDSFSSSPIPSPKEMSSFSFPENLQSSSPIPSRSSSLSPTNFSPHVTSFFSKYNLQTKSEITSSSLPRVPSVPPILPSSTTSSRCMSPDPIPFPSASSLPSTSRSVTPSSTELSRHKLVKKKLQPPKKGLEHVGSMFEEFKREEAERRS